MEGLQKKNWMKFILDKNQFDEGNAHLLEHLVKVERAKGSLHAHRAGPG